MSRKDIHLIFKTHLDIGFTDHAARVRRQYHEQFIPQAIATGAHFYAENPAAPAFIWTTGAWLIWDHLETQDKEKVRALEQAIERGLVTWHALPFTTHTELMSAELFEAGLSYAQALDSRFGRKTIAAKMTDVPGHTLGMVPLLARAGVKFLHLGVNTASPVPDVPPIFRWQAPDGSEVVVMYQGSYGATDFPAGEDVGLSFAHTNDNIGPQSVGQTVEALRHLQKAHPEARIVASTLDAFGALMWERRESLPVVTVEIGDSWIHGAASDPIKLQRFKALQRFHDALEPTPERQAFGRGLTLVAEHTWGVDIKTYLRDETAWDRADFQRARASDYRFAYAEQSWAEQRGYLQTALSALGPDDRAEAEEALGALEVSAAPEPQDETEISDGGWRADLDPASGDIVQLVSPAGRVLGGTNGSIFGYRHESYDAHELKRHLDSYLQHREEWAILDHDKPGLERAQTARTACFVPEHLGVSADRRTGIARLPDDASALLGGPLRHEISLRGIDDSTVEITLVLRDKPANRMPEAGFLFFTPAGGQSWSAKKMGLWHRTENIVRRGGGQLQAVEAVSVSLGSGTVTVTPLDSALVAPARSPFMPFQPERPDFSRGVRFNLYNNKWGTNFPMWWDGTVKMRFVVTLG